MKTNRLDKSLFSATILAVIIYAFIAFWIVCLLKATSAHAGALLLPDGTYVITNPLPNVKLAWTYPTNKLSGTVFNVYYGPSHVGYTNKVFGFTTTNASITLSNDTRGTTVFFAVTAVDNQGLESQFSNEVSWSPNAIPVAPVQNPPVTVVAQHSSSPAGPFSDTEMAWSVDPGTSTNDFFRLRIVASSDPPTTQNTALPMFGPPKPLPLPGQ